MTHAPSTPRGQATHPRVYATYFDSAYETRGRLLVESLRETGELAPVVVVCFDDASLDRVGSWPFSDVIPVSIAEVESRIPELVAVKGERSPAEYFFTCTAWVTELAMTHCAPDGWTTYLDADLYFFGSPAPIYDELADHSIGMIDHFYRPDHQHLHRFGRFNVGWVSFRNDFAGRAALRWWGEQCLDWCGDQPSQGRFADQGYLNQFPARFEGVHEIQHPGANLGPFNLDTRVVTGGSDGRVGVNGQDLLFFHFHGVRRMFGRYVAMLIPFGTTSTQVVRDRIYHPYVDRLADAEARWPAPPPAKRGYGWRGVASRLRRRAYYARSVLRGESWQPAAQHSQDSDRVSIPSTSDKS